MTCRDWVALAMLWWKDGWRQPIADWLTDPHRATVKAWRTSFESVAASIDVRLATAPAIAKARALAQTALETATRAGLHVIPWPDPRYPKLLTSIADPPPVLWIRGDVTALDSVAVALVGSRAAIDHAKEVGYELGLALAARGVTVVSGLARGVDSTAHRGALSVDGRTVTVLGSGVDTVYPREHTTLAQDVVRRGLVLSEFPPGTPPRAAHFPQRNRLISGLSQVVVVVEASRRSGSLITARLGLEQGREVMAVPGTVLGRRNVGAHALLKDSAKLVEDVDDILTEIGPGVCARVIPTEGAAPDDVVLRHLDHGESYDLDQLVARCGLEGARLLPRLLELELAGRIVRRDGGRYLRTANCGGRQ